MVSNQAVANFDHDWDVQPTNEEDAAIVECLPRISVTHQFRSIWTVPGDKTPATTMCATILKNNTNEGKVARSKKYGRGQFALNDWPVRFVFEPLTAAGGMNGREPAIAPESPTHADGAPDRQIDNCR